MATRAIEVRDQFLSIASHELKTPLTPLQLHVQMLQKAAGSSNERLLAERIGPKLDSISRQVSRLASLIDDLLDISRITAGRMRLEREEVDLGDVVREVGTRFAVELSRTGGDLRIDAPGPVVGVWDGCGWTRSSPTCWATRSSSGSANRSTCPSPPPTDTRR
jgi:signal transduction histidine kinase